MSKLILFPLIIVMTMMGSLGGFFFKKCTAGGSLIEVIRSRFLYLGGLFYVISAFMNIWVLKYLPYSVVMPLCSITYIWSLTLSCVLLGEKFSVRKLIGIAAILAGATLIGLF